MKEHLDILKIKMKEHLDISKEKISVMQPKPDELLFQTLEDITERVMKQYKKVKGVREKKAYLAFVADFVQYINLQYMSQAGN